MLAIGSLKYARGGLLVKADHGGVLLTGLHIGHSHYRRSCRRHRSLLLRTHNQSLLLVHKSLFRFFPRKQRLYFQKVCIVSVVLRLDLRSEGWVEHFGRVEGLRVLLTLNDLCV